MYGGALLHADLIVLDMLTPAERLAFVLHDLSELRSSPVIQAASPIAVPRVAGPRGERAKGALPGEAGGDGLPFQIVAARYAEEAGMEGQEIAHQVDTHPVWPVIPGGREERDQSKPDLPRVCPRNDEGALSSMARLAISSP